MPATPEPAQEPPYGTGRRIGLFGGSFDPIHNGHLILAREAIERLQLDFVVFIPARISPHKLDRHPAPPEIREAMIRAAIAGEPRFFISDCELRREGPSFTFDTVRSIRGQTEAELFYLVGEDNLAKLHTWHRIGELRELARFVLLGRAGVKDAGDLPLVSRNIDISSTEIRNRVARGLSVRYLLPEAACEIITQRRLYLDDH